MGQSWNLVLNVTYFFVSLLGLPDALLLSILKKLNWLHIFDSLFNVEKCLDRLIINSIIYAPFIDLIVMSSTGRFDSIAKTIPDRICSSVLP